MGQRGSGGAIHLTTNDALYCTYHSFVDFRRASMPSPNKLSRSVSSKTQRRNSVSRRRTTAGGCWNGRHGNRPPRSCRNSYESDIGDRLLRELTVLHAFTTSVYGGPLNASMWRAKSWSASRRHGDSSYRINRIRCRPGRLGRNEVVRASAPWTWSANVRLAALMQPDPARASVEAMVPGAESNPRLSN